MVTETVIVKLQACNLSFTEKIAPSTCFPWKFAISSEQTSRTFEQLHGKLFVNIAQAQPGLRKHLRWRASQQLLMVKSRLLLLQSSLS